MCRLLQDVLSQHSIWNHLCPQRDCSWPCRLPLILRIQYCNGECQWGLPKPVSVYVWHSCIGRTLDILQSLCATTGNEYIKFDSIKFNGVMHACPCDREVIYLFVSATSHLHSITLIWEITYYLALYKLTSFQSQWYWNIVARIVNCSIRFVTSYLL